jgi:hypothetical protein
MLLNPVLKFKLCIIFRAFLLKSLLIINDWQYHFVLLNLFIVHMKHMKFCKTFPISALKHTGL